MHTAQYGQYRGTNARHSKGVLIYLYKISTHDIEAPGPPYEFEALGAR